MLRCVSRTLRSYIDDGEDGWALIARIMSHDLALYLPDGLVMDWRTFFWDQLFPARNKWSSCESLAQDHKIRVAVRFKPGHQEDTGMILPLHQRLKMLKKGQKISREEAMGQHKLSVSEIKSKFLGNESDISSELMEMLQDAKNLFFANSRAQSDAQTNVFQLNGQEVDRISAHSQGSAVGAGPDANEVQPMREHSAHASGAGTSSGGEKKNSCDTHAADENQGQRRLFGRSKVLSVDQSSVAAYIPGVGVRSFRFSNVMDAEVNQQVVYASFARNAVVSALNGFNSCVLAYGQTGSGKTFSLFGPPQWMDELDDSSLGIVLRSMWELLDARDKMRQEELAALAISVQYVQVYQEIVTDLVDGKKVNLRTSSSGFELHGAAESTITSRKDLLEVFQRGEENKRYRATAMNERSSRAHTILVVNLQQRKWKQSSGSEERQQQQMIIRSQLVLADLAGCEHISKSKVEGNAKREAASINSGLLVLKKCIKALNEERSHVPFLESRLTMLLKGALGGSSRTYVLVTGTLDDSHGDETIEALRFGEHCQNITNQTKMQKLSVASALEVIDVALRQCEEGIRSLKERGRTELPAFRSLVAKHAALSRKRNLLSSAS